MTAPETEPARYRLGPRSTRGLIAGWRTGQIACVGIGLLLAVGFLRAVGGGAGAFLGLVAVGGGVAVATWPLGGRTPEQWVPTVASFGLRAVADATYKPWRSSSRRGQGAFGGLVLAQLAEPGEWEPAWREGLEAVSAQMRAGRRRDGPAHSPPLSTGIGVVSDSMMQTRTAVVPVGGTGFALLSDADRVERIAAWSGALAALARDTAGLHRLQWLSSTYPSWLDRALPSGDVGSSGKHYARLLQESSRNLWTHEVYVAVSVRYHRSARRAEAPDEALREQLSMLAERLRGAGLVPGAPLSPLALASIIRRGFEMTPPTTEMAWPWPVGVESSWRRLRTDATWHTTYWVAEWPRGDVGAGFLLPMLLEPGLRRVVSVTMAPIAAVRAVRRAERERTEGTVDAEMRGRHGFALTARAVREQQSRQQRESELAEGHAGYQFSGYVTVTEADQEELERVCGRLEQSAALAQLELRRLYGAQVDGYCCTLPTGRGCR